jgi:hypothetical protein
VRFRSGLGVNKATIDYVKQFADPVRHGAPKPISDAERAEVFRKTWSVVDRFIDFAARGYSAAKEGSSLPPEWTAPLRHAFDVDCS